MQQRVRTLLVAVTAAVALVAPSVLVSTAAQAAPRFSPHIDVYLADGVTPVADTVVHPGDTLVVKGRGFDPNSNTSGLPVPVPPGVPHGTFIAFGAFAPVWQPSKDALESARATSRLGVQWAISPSALAKVPTEPFDLQRAIRQQWVPLDADGTFTARVVTTTPAKQPAGARYGIYTYGAAGATNAAQELSVPVNYSTESGPNTPVPAPQNFVWGYSPSFYNDVTETTQGTVFAIDGAGIDDRNRLTYRLAGGEVRNGTGELRYEGTVVAFTRFHLWEIALADPIIRVRDGKGVLSMKTSTENDNGDDTMRRIDIADVDLSGIGDGRDVTGAKVTFRPGISPLALALLSTGPAAPLDLRFP